MSRMFLQQLANGLVIGSIYVLMALGLTMIYGIAKILHVAHGAVFTTGAYAAILSFFLFKDFTIAIITAPLIGAATGIVVEFFVYRALLRKPPLIALISGIGAYILMSEVFRIFFSPFRLFYSTKIGLGSLNASPYFILTDVQILIIIATFGSLIALWTFFNKTKIGLAVQGTVQNFEGASIIGIDTHKTILVNFIIGSAMAGLAGALVGIYFNTIYPTLGDLVAYKGFVIIVLGGLGSVFGCVIGGLALGFTETLLTGYFLIPLPREAIAFIVFILVLIFRPRGLLGKEW